MADHRFPSPSAARASNTNGLKEGGILSWVVGVAAGALPPGGPVRHIRPLSCAWGAGGAHVCAGGASAGRERCSVLEGGAETRRISSAATWWGQRG